MRPIAVAIGLLASVALFGQGQAQLPYIITVTGTVLGELDGDPVKGATVLVNSDGVAENVLTPKRNGRYTFELQRGKAYELTYTAPGQVSKRVVIDTHGAPPLLDVPSITMTVEITLFPPVEGMDTKLFQEPLGRASYKHSVRNIVWDKTYGEAKRAELRRYMAGYDKELNGPFVTEPH
ncbi:MAG: carboxypeptidase-like regulatory domain-containing protein [Flavobacteriales bacterium]